MIRRLLAAWRHADEIAELRDRAAIEATKASRTAEINGSLLTDNASLIAQLDQNDTTLRNIAGFLAELGHSGTNSRCPSCIVIAAIHKTRQASNANHPTKDHRQP